MNFYYIILSVTLLLVISIDAQLYTAGVRKADLQRNQLARFFTCSKGGPQCADCRTLIVCPSGLPNPIQTIECQLPTPHCVINECRANASSICTYETPFTCTSLGVFPDPFDCTRYRVCHDETIDEYDSDLYVCPTGYIFNTKMSVCEKVPSTPQSCGKIDCSKSSNKIILYPSNPAYYAFCMDYGNGTIHPLLYKCEFEQFEIYNIAMGECTFNCKAKGSFQNPANCQQYYVCSAAGAMADLVSCPRNFVFDGTSCTMDERKCQYPPPLPPLPPPPSIPPGGSNSTR